MCLMVVFAANKITKPVSIKEVEKTEPEYDSGMRLDSNNAQFILFYQTKVDNEIKKLQQEIARLKDVSKEMYSIEVSFKLHLSETLA